MKKSLVFIALSIIFLFGCSKTIPDPNISPEFPFKSNFINIDNSRIHYIDEGKGDTVILLLHGVPENCYIWRNIIPITSKHTRTIAVDFLGFGKSDKPIDANYDLKSQTNRLSDFIDNMKLDKIIIVGMDMGLMVGLNYAMTHQEKISGIVMFEGIYTSINVYNKNSSPVLTLITKIMLKNYDNMYSKDTKAIVSMITGGTIRKLSSFEIENYARSFTDRDIRMAVLVNGIGAKQIYSDSTNPNSLTSLVDNYAIALTKSNIPKLILYANPGLSVNKKTLNYAKQNIPNVILNYVGKGKHYLPEDQPTNIGNSIIDFIKTISIP